MNSTKQIVARKQEKTPFGEMTRRAFWVALFTPFLLALYRVFPTLAPAPVPAIVKWDPILISMVRRAMPNLIAYDLCGVQPMTGPTGLIFTMRNRYEGGRDRNNEPLFARQKREPVPLPVKWLDDYQRFSNQIGRAA